MRSARSFVGDKREAILRAAIKVFANSGYFNSKVADIAREAGVADGTVYLYFKSKEDILHSIFDRSVEEALDTARKQVAEVTDPKEKLRQTAISQLSFKSNCAAQPSLWKSFRPPASPSISR